MEDLTLALSTSQKGTRVTRGWLQRGFSKVAVREQQSRRCDDGHLRLVDWRVAELSLVLAGAALPKDALTN